MNLEDLNKKQLEAVKYVKGPLSIIAGAGSGKTRVITHKIIYLISEKKLNPSKILAITFTNKAAKEMKERVVSSLKKQGEKCKISTYHSLCGKILREDIDKFGFTSRFNILDTTDQKFVLSSIYKELDFSSKTHSYNEMIDYISKVKANEETYEILISRAKSDTDKIFAKVYKMYIEELKKANSLDFDDLIIYTCKLFKKHPEVAHKWARRFDYILVDEFQDTSKHQYEIIKLLTNKNKMITIVGDPDQTIFTWRKADPTLLLNFKDHFNGTKEIILDINYRSTSNILDAANNLIKNNKNRPKKELKSTKGEGEPIEFYHGFSDEAEARWIVSRIQNLCKNKTQLKNIAILYRANYLSNTIEKALINENINYVVYGGTRFYQRQEIKDAISYLKIINNGDELSIKRMINIPARKIGPSSFKWLLETQEEKQKRFFDMLVEDFNALNLKDLAKKELKIFLLLIKKYREALKSFPLHIVLEKFLIEVGYFKLFKASEESSKLDNLKELIKSLKDWEEKNPEKGLSEYIDEISLFLDSGENKSKDYVSLLTVHSSKGLEYENVFLMGFSDGVFPSNRAMEEKKGLEEERRLAYVAITRAKKKLFVSDSKGYSINFKLQKKPSRFLKEMKISFKKFVHEFIPIEDEENYLRDRNFIVGDKVQHINFGEGVVVNLLDDEIIEIAFKDPHGTKTLLKNHKAISKLEN